MGAIDSNSNKEESSPGYEGGDGGNDDFKFRLNED